ncbi:MAG: FG-GAP-like repeat-containing protein, partial [Chloroflexi bacterium]|nr:FG-GAP-like repeat-containing protein [Chloroflexota bacterium]
LEAVRLAPNEPAAWADLGLIYLRAGNMAAAAKALETARSLAPGNGDIQLLIGLMQSRQGSPTAMGFFRKAIELDPSSLYARYALVQEIERVAAPDAETQMRKQLDGILKIQPENLIALLESARLAAKQNDKPALQKSVARLSALSATWPADPKTRLATVQHDLLAANVQPAAIDLVFLRNVLQATPQFHASIGALQPDEAAVGVPIEQFLRLPIPTATAGAPDTALRFTAQADSGKCDWEAALPLSADGPPTVIRAASGRITLDTTPGVTLPFPVGSAPSIPARGVLAIDWNNDFKPDLCLAGAGGLRFFQQTSLSHWTDVTAQTKLPPGVLHGSYLGAWAADVDLDGHLDIVLGAVSGSPTVLLNNGDGSWTAIHPFPGVSGVRDFAWVDITGDAAPEAALVDAAGKLTVFSNDRAGHYASMPAPPVSGRVLSLSAADVDQDGRMDLVTLTADGAVNRISLRAPGAAAAGNGWDVAKVAQWKDVPTDGTAALYWTDLDNNGALDMVASGPRGSQVWLGGTKGQLTPLSTPINARVLSVVDLNGDGRLDLVGVSPAGAPVRLINHGATAYGWQNIKPRALLVGAQRNNSFGVGGSIEVRAGLLVQMEPICGPVVHFGLGDAGPVNAARLVWPNGSTQGEFDLKPNQVVNVPQRPTGSCPWLFAWNGRSMQFVTDILWKSPLGLRIDAQKSAGVAQTRDWVKIPAGGLVARSGFYDLRITAELWETHFFDYVRLMTVDHPATSDVFVDERFAMPQPPLVLYATGSVIPIESARDDRGQDVTSVLKSTDGRYLGTFGPGAYQGITRDHFVEVTLGNSVPRTGHVFLVASGWIHPTDSSINVAISHGHHPRPEGLSLESQDETGRWHAVRSGLGFPAGKNKTVLIDLTGVPRPAAGRPWRLRLRTNLEIFWDSIGAAVAMPQTPVRTRLITPCTANLRYRGFSAARQASWSSPELPDYNQLAGTAPRWYDLTGYYTRFGDVRPLLQTVDDRYVIMNAGDEIALRFPAPPPPPAGWTRDFIFVSDGWEKDGNFNTTFSATVLPLPSHDNPAYSTPPTTLENDPVYRRHSQDWQQYQTRYVTPDSFRQAFWGFTSRARR